MAVFATYPQSLTSGGESGLGKNPEHVAPVNRRVSSKVHLRIVDAPVRAMQVSSHMGLPCFMAFPKPCGGAP